MYFFFSSRRRHTRLVSDWSSDVCSSDLVARWISEQTGRLVRPQRGWEYLKRLNPGQHSSRQRHARAKPPARYRSEERRVGKRVELGGRRAAKNKREWRTGTGR